MWVHRLKIWKTIPTRARIRLMLASESRRRRPPGSSTKPMGRPSRNTIPSLGSSRKLTQRSSVLLPEPLGPTTQIFSPAATSRLIPRRTCRRPNHLCRLVMRMIAGGGTDVLTRSMAYRSTAANKAAVSRAARRVGRRCRPGSTALARAAGSAQRHVVLPAVRLKCGDSQCCT